MTPFEKITGTATSVVFVAGVLAAVLLSGASGVTISAQGGDPAAPSEAHLAGSSDESTTTTRGGSTSSVSRDGRANHDGTGADDVKAGEAVPQHRSTPTTLPGDALGLLDQLVGLIPDADLRALTDLLESLDPALLDDVLDQLEAALGTGDLQALVDQLLGQVEIPAPTTLPPLTVPDLTGSLDDPTKTVDGVVDDTTGAVDSVVDDITGTVDDTTGTVDDVVGSITGSGDTAKTVEDTTKTVEDTTKTVTDTVGGLL